MNFKLQALPQLNLAIFASGSGTNAEAIISHFKGHSKIQVKLVVTNKKEAGIWKVADRNQVPCYHAKKSTLYESNDIVTLLKEKHINWIILAGFLLKIPKNILEAYPNEIINIHPALLPKFGGKGMYGMHVHKAVVEANEKETGITIHKVNENYDEGAIISQFSTAVHPDDTPEDVQQKVQQLEHKHFPREIEKHLLNL
ncbi:phosphoribosylglycinamide formyltransferase [Luteibaculum oceani]|uniref:Phosphoribosylglycinamide formyltransferase n=1 Tax=Luteibaculum oceani TaxID=1294296 RepID=A0A5C6VIW8_9FLAO|nr:phosphoribosylglycinamide formyltransferase [Luteibaculum oceani]TXC85403.1 phosphoribosylglycinamide formyltransferase [Luteibaculum oceani]